MGTRERNKWLTRIRTVLVSPLLLVIWIYQHAISPFIPSTCRFTPTCSQYAVEALKKRGLFVGLYLTVRRLIRCNPWGGHGHDPVP